MLFLIEADLKAEGIAGKRLRPEAEYRSLRTFSPVSASDNDGRTITWELSNELSGSLATWRTSSAGRHIVGTRHCTRDQARNA